MQTAQFIGQSTLQEAPDSPQWGFTVEKGASVTRTFRGTYALAMASRPPLNAFGTGIYAGLRITSVEVHAEKPGIGVLTWTMTGALITDGLPELPPDTCSIEPAKQEFALESHPRYSSLDDDEKDAIHQALNATDETQRKDANNSVDAFDLLASNTLRRELLEKLKKQQTHYVLYLGVYTWSLSSLTLPAADPGGYIQLPYGPIPAPVGPETGWLREADKLEWTGSFWKLTRSWIAGIDIDPNIYPV